MILFELVQHVEEEFCQKVLAIMPSSFNCDPYDETYWVVFDDGKRRSIEWLVGAKSIGEESGPIADDCPLIFFEIVPEVNEEWRKRCTDNHA